MAPSKDIDHQRGEFETYIRSLNPKQLFVARWPDGSYKHHGTDGMWAGWQAAVASQVSPRATADVERDEDWSSRGSMEEFAEAADLVDAINACETKGDALGLVLMYRKAIRLATTKPGA